MTLNLRGTWASNGTYAAYDVVQYANDKYVSLITNTGTLPPTDLSHNGAWSGLVFASNGAFYYVNSSNLQVAAFF